MSQKANAKRILDIKVDIWRKNSKGDGELKKNVKLIQLKEEQPAHTPQGGGFFWRVLNDEF